MGFPEPCLYMIFITPINNQVVSEKLPFGQNMRKMENFRSRQYYFDII